MYSCIQSCILNMLIKSNGESSMKIKSKPLMSPILHRIQMLIIKYLSYEEAENMQSILQMTFTIFFTAKSISILIFQITKMGPFDSKSALDQVIPWHRRVDMPLIHLPLEKWPPIRRQYIQLQFREGRVIHWTNKDRGQGHHISLPQIVNLSCRCILLWCARSKSIWWKQLPGGI